MGYLLGVPLQGLAYMGARYGGPHQVLRCRRFPQAGLLEFTCKGPLQRVPASWSPARSRPQEFP
jgi:hypothetical protein